MGNHIEATNYIDAPTLSKIEGLIKDKIGCIDDLIIIIKYAKVQNGFTITSIRFGLILYIVSVGI